MASLTGSLEKLDNYRWKLPASFKAGMRVPGLIYSDQNMLRHILQEHAAEQVANVAFFSGDYQIFSGNAGRSLGLRFSHRRSCGL